MSYELLMNFNPKFSYNVIPVTKSWIKKSGKEVAFCGLALEYDPESNLASECIYEQYSSYCKGKQVVPKDEVRFFKSLYLHFGNKVFKRRLKESEGLANRRIYVIQGVSWKEEYESCPSSPIKSIL